MWLLYSHLRWRKCNYFKPQPERRLNERSSWGFCHSDEGFCFRVERLFTEPSWDVVYYGLKVCGQEVSWAAKKHIRMISEISCDTEEWRYDVETLHHRNKWLFTVYANRKVILNCNNISQYWSFYGISNQINAALVSTRGFLQIRHKKYSK